MRTLAIFNPEHDLCLANGNEHYVPPQSALAFAAEGCWMMGALFDDAVVATCKNCGELYREIAALHDESSIRIEAWGWDSAVRWQTIKQGIPERMLPDRETIALIRSMQHRTTTLPLQPANEACKSIAEVEAYLRKHQRIVLKAPWSGSGRGLRWIDNALSRNDRLWIDKIVAEQQCVIAEPRRHVVIDFAIELRRDAESVSNEMHLSLFETQNGVYRGNRLLSDSAIEERITHYVPLRELREAEAMVADFVGSSYKGYLGPVGVDMFVYHDAEGYHLNPCVEINLRHTMGMVAHAIAQRHTERHGELWSPMR